MAEEIAVDALPYIDLGYDEPGVRESVSFFVLTRKTQLLIITDFVSIKVYAMIEDECKRYKPTKNYLEHLPPLRLHDFEVR